MIIFTANAFISCGDQKYERYEQQEFLMGTMFKITLLAGNNLHKKGDLEEIARNAFSSVNEVEQEMSEWIESSPISQVATFAGKNPISISDDVIKVVDAALEISRDTEGAFDISFKPLGYVWDIKERKEPPAKGDIAEAQQLVDYKNIILDEANKTLFLAKKGMSIGLGGIAKGFGALRAAEVIKGAGIDNFIIDAGGDLYFEGDKMGTPWVSAIRDPYRSGELLEKYIIHSPVSMVTSGDYENYFEFEGKRYHHIINPVTGYPAYGIRSVTVFARDPMCADAYATAFFIIGYERSMEILKKRKDLAFIMVTDENEILKSENINDFATRLSD